MQALPRGDNSLKGFRVLSLLLVTSAGDTQTALETADFAASGLAIGRLLSPMSLFLIRDVPPAIFFHYTTTKFGLVILVHTLAQETQ